MRAKRKELPGKIAQRDLAKRMNTSQQQVSKWETNREEPALSVVERLATLLRTNIGYLAGEHSYPDPITDQEAKALADLRDKGQFVRRTDVDNWWLDDLTKQE